jgi:hypothetical protein
MASTNFGKSNTKQSFTVKASAAHVLLPVLKSGLVSKRILKQTLRDTDPRVKFLVNCWEVTKQINFRILQHPSCNWNTQPCIDRDHMKLQTACLFHYDLEMAMVQQFCGWYLLAPTGNELLYWISYTVPPTIYHELQKVYFQGSPNELVSHEQNDFENFKKY